MNLDDIIMLGDYNVDVSRPSTAKRKLDQFTKSKSLFQLIDVPTRTTVNTKSIIDHIYTNNQQLYNHKGVLNPGLSDHSLVYTSRKRLSVNKEKVFKTIRNYRNFDQTAFAHDVGNTDWLPVYNCETVNEACEVFQSLFMYHVNKHLPKKRIRVRASTAPWVTSEFLSLLDRRAYVCKLFDKCPCHFHRALKAEARRQCQRMKNALKKAYMSTCVERHKHNPKKLWQNIRLFWPNSKSSQSTIKQIADITDDKQKADYLNEHFCNTGKRIQSNINHDIDWDMFMPNSLPPVFELLDFTPDDISKAIDRLSNSGASSVDDITSLMVKSCKTELLNVLCYLCNMSIRQKCYPDIWKIAQVTPLFKQGSHVDPNNYRPISVLPTFGKLLERVIQKQCLEYLESNNLLSDHQFGFRANRSTGTCLIDFLHNVYSSIDKGQGCGALYLDLAKAFDCVEHETLLRKL